MGIIHGEIDIFGVLESLDKMPQQRQFISAPQQNAAYVGGQGSGKSIALCSTAILNALDDPNGYSLIGRLHMPALESTTMKTFLELAPEDEGRWHASKKMFRFANGHEVIFRHLDITDPKIVGHIKSLNLSAAYVDEATEISLEVYYLLVGRIRRKTAKRRIMRLASNPAGHDWVWKHFFDPKRRPQLLNSNLGITASTMDNPFLPAEYVQNMLNTYPEDWAQRFIYGSFNDFSDVVYKEFTEATHVWNADKRHAVFGGETEPPLEWPVIIGIDIGSDMDPWACTIDAVAPNGTLFQYAEVYGSSLLIAEIAAQIHEKVGGRRIFGMAYDYANRQAALELAEHGIFGQPAIKEVRPGLFKMAQYYHIDPRLEHPFDPEVKGSPRAFISSRCINSIRETGAYKWHKDRSGNPTGEPAHDNSHSPDARRYAIHTFRPFPEKTPVPRKWENPELDALSRMYWRDEERFQDRSMRFSPRAREHRTIQDWQQMAAAGPRRFQRPRYSKFVRV